MMPIVSEGHTQTPLRLIPECEDDTASERLPLLTTAADVREIVQYLVRKPAGVMPAEELDRPKKRLFEDRKLAAYDLLGLTSRAGSLIRLSSLGWTFAADFDADAKVFRVVLQRTPAYLAALKWIHEQNIDMITSTELLGFWVELRADLPSNDHETARGAVVSFFSICQAAVLGTMTLGKRGHITRFCVDRDELIKFLDASTLDPHMTRSNKTEMGEGHHLEGSFQICQNSEQPRVMIQGGNKTIVNLLLRTLRVAGMASELVASVWDCKTTFADRDAMFREYAAMLVILDEQSFTRDDVGTWRLNERISMELGAAHVLHDRRVIVLRDKKVTSPDGLKDLVQFEFHNDHMDWQVGLELIETVHGFVGTSS